MEVEALLDPKNTGNLNLRQNDVVRQSSNQPVIEDLLWLGKRSLYVQRPGARGATQQPEALGQQQSDYCDYQQDQEDDKK